MIDNPGGPGSYATPGAQAAVAAAQAKQPLPDYASILANDPVYQQLLGSLASARASDSATRAAQINSALVQYGSVPDLTSAGQTLGFDVSGLVDPTTAQLAQENTDAGTSTVAGETRNYNNSVQQLKQALAARGMLSSGATGVGLGQQQQTYNQNQYDDTQKLLSYLAGVQQAFTQNQTSENTQQVQGADDAYTRAVQLYGGQDAPTTTTQQG